MNSEIVKTGDKIDIRILQQVEQGKKTGERPPAYRSKVQNILQDGSLEVSVPTEGGSNVSLPSGIRLEFMFYTQQGMYRCVAHIRDRYIRDNLYLLRIEAKTPLEKFQRREYYRFECVMDMFYLPITPEEAELESMEEVREHHRLTYPEDLPKEAVAVDLSGGGLRFIGHEPEEKGAYLLLTIRLENESMDHLLEIVGNVLTCQRVETSAKEEKYEYRVNFLMKNQKEREMIIKYIFEQERRSRQKG